MEYIVETNKLTKLYKDKKVVNNVNIHVKKGEIYGFVGPNGAGKSTVLKMLLNLVKPDSGEIKIFGKKVDDNNFEILKRMGSIIENPYFYDGLTARENLELHCEYMGCHNKENIDKTLELVSLTDVEGKTITQYSLGMKQRLAIARAILTKPELVILDEPINALDPEGIREMRSLIRNLNQEWGISMIISSHILPEMEMIADTIGIIKEGELLQEVAMKDILAYHTEYIEVEVDNAGKAVCLLKDKLRIKDYTVISNNKVRIFNDSISNKDLSMILINNGVQLESLKRHENTLEEYFFEITKKGEKIL